MSLFTRKNLLSVFLITILASAEIFFRFKGIPIPLGDAPAYYVPGIVFSESGNLVHPFWAPGSTDGGPFLWHGWIHSYVNGMFGRVFSGGLTGVRVSETIIVTIGCILFSRVVSNIKKDISLIVHISAVLSTTVVSFSMFGRPESAAFTLLVAGAFVLQRLEKGPVRTGLIVVLWGGLGATQPTVALLAGPVLLGYLILTSSSPISALAEWIAVGAASVLVTFLLTIVVYPYSLTEWINGLLVHAEKTASRTDSGRFIHYYFLQPDLFMQGSIFIFSILLLSLIKWDYYKYKNWYIIGVIIVWSFISWYTSIRIPATHYNLFALYPIFVIFMLYCLKVFRERYKYIISVSSILLIGIFSVLIVGRRYVVFEKSLDGSSVKDVRSVIDNLPNEAEISIDQSLMISAYSPDEWSRFNTSHGSLSYDGRYLILKQAASGKFKPPNIEGFELMKDTFNDNPIYFGPVKLANTYDSYNFALYKNVK